MQLTQTNRPSPTHVITPLDLSFRRTLTVALHRTTSSLRTRTVVLTAPHHHPANNHLRLSLSRARNTMHTFTAAQIKAAKKRYAAARDAAQRCRHGREGSRSARGHGGARGGVTTSPTGRFSDPIHRPPCFPVRCGVWVYIRGVGCVWGVGAGRIGRRGWGATLHVHRLLFGRHTVTVLPSMCVEFGENHACDSQTRVAFLLCVCAILHTARAVLVCPAVTVR